MPKPQVPLSQPQEAKGSFSSDLVRVQMALDVRAQMTRSPRRVQNDRVW